jgi:hypothetical protein
MIFLVSLKHLLIGLAVLVVVLIGFFRVTRTLSPT